MIECKMGISADTLVLVHSSTKVSNKTWNARFEKILSSPRGKLKTQKTGVSFVIITCFS